MINARPRFCSGAGSSEREFDFFVVAPVVYVGDIFNSRGGSALFVYALLFCRRRCWGQKKEPAQSRLFGMEVFVRAYSARFVRLP